MSDDDKAERERLVEYIAVATRTVPPSVMAGSYQKAVMWKQEASKALKAAQSRVTQLEKLRTLAASLRQYEA